MVRDVPCDSLIERKIDRQKPLATGIAGGFSFARNCVRLRLAGARLATSAFMLRPKDLRSRFDD